MSSEESTFQRLNKEDNNKNQRDINEIFNDITLSEERLGKEAYDEGYQVGCQQGGREGYQLGYAQGEQLGVELGHIFGTVVALQLQTHTDKVNRALQQLRKSIEDFPRTNDPEEDIIGAVQSIRLQFKRLNAMLGSKLNKAENSEKDDTKDYSF